ncbi:dTDP-D-glucose 4,6-dehydratase [Pelotomaculum thermopropionicum SI]|uniref:dTDP-glucose 4,6-dehydratase n=1 Tax=Pelotomaculum thermopropionicum (strain DSM 13744 / JCM 10971 / SI) TaxID=370438 RepID=A5CZ12_PELTS|nr:dTDP-D-glucose 4,6-dehydratase [Pelotomaculum thermopropionicum SI]
MGKRYLVTGGAGFIGSNFIIYLLTKYENCIVINLDKLTYAGCLENLAAIKDSPRYQFYKGDIADKELVGKILAGGIDVIVNFAAESHVDRSIHDPGIFVKTNVLGTQVLLDGALKFGIKKFVQISTDEVYGSLGASGYFREDMPLCPNSPYSASKAAADLLVHAYRHTFGLNVNITRCSNNYGPYQFPEKLIPLMITNALEDLPLPVYGDGLNVRDWLHVKDHCAAIDCVIENGRPGEVYNIGGNNEKTNLEIVKTILRILGKNENLIKFVKDRPGHDRRYAIDAGKIMKELGWMPEYSFEQGIQSTIEWYIKNEAWWKRIKSGEYKEYYQKMYNDLF